MTDESRYERGKSGFSEIVQMYELIYYLYKIDRYDKKALRILYKYQYYLTYGDKRVNPEWGSFIEQMDVLYSGIM